MLRLTIIVIGFFIYSASFLGTSQKAYPEKLSDWGIYEGKLSLMKPKPGIIPYDLNTPLFSDYAEKLRFIRMPAGTSVQYSPKGVPDFPEGTLLIKNFYFSADQRRPGKNKNIIETRLLEKKSGEWKALVYTWNEAQTEAFLEIAGDEHEVRFIDDKGNKQQVRYLVPNLNQCKGCHNTKDKLLPIGPTVSQLNRNYTYASGRKNQLEYWKQSGMIRNLPGRSAIPRTAVWNDPATGDLNARARAYLAINCAHCHSREGPAQTSGLYLGEDEQDSTAIGINKSPVAAGKGSGGRMVDILPGDANASITWYRMQTHESGERMPELGRTSVHKEGVALIQDWINKMK